MDQLSLGTNICNEPVSQSCAVAKIEVYGPLDNQTWQTNVWPQQKLSKSFFYLYSHTALWPMEQSSIISAKFDCPVARQNVLLLTTAHDRESGLLEIKTKCNLNSIVIIS